MHRVAIICFFLVISVFPGWSAEPESPTIATANLAELKARIVRLRQKSEQAWALFNQVATRRYATFILDPKSNRPETELLSVYRELYFAASATNKVSKLVCLEQVTKFLCTRIFEPKWLVSPNDANPSVETLTDGMRETEIAIEPIWQGLCKLAAERAGNEVCRV